MLKPSSGQGSLSLPLENGRKRLVSHCFLGLRKGTLPRNGLNIGIRKQKKESTCIQHGINVQNITSTGAKNNTLFIIISEKIKHQTKGQFALIKFQKSGTSGTLFRHHYGI